MTSVSAGHIIRKVDDCGMKATLFTLVSGRT